MPTDDVWAWDVPAILGQVAGSLAGFVMFLAVIMLGFALLRDISR
jgi:hypothetical protein